MEHINAKLRSIPAIDKLLSVIQAEQDLRQLPHELVVKTLRKVVEETRHRLRQGHDADTTTSFFVSQVRSNLDQVIAPSLKKVINATGVVLHTNLGRAPLSERAKAHVRDVIDGYSTLEYDVQTGGRGSRYEHVVSRLQALTGAEDAIVVNNNAAAVMLVLSVLAAGREVIVSRGQLVEIGGSFRIPEVMKLSGATLVEVGTTNKTHLADYEAAITPATAAILKVHTSNYRVVGFTSQPEAQQLAALAHAHNLPLIDDLGSGTLLPISAGGLAEPTVNECLAAGADIVTFSGDKLLGAGQAGIIAGKKCYIEQMKKHQLLRAFRIDKLSLAALEGTLLDYLMGDPLQDVPAQRMLNTSPGRLKLEAEYLAAQLQALTAYGWAVDVVSVQSQAGGGSLPAVNFGGYGVALTCKISASVVERKLRMRPLPIIVRIQEDKIVFDVRCLSRADMDEIRAACLAIAKEVQG